MNIRNLKDSEHRIIEINETSFLTNYDGDRDLFDTFAIRISTRRIEAFLVNNSFEFSYVESTIQDAMNGSTSRYGSRKYSFGDCADWYDALKAPRNCTDPVIKIEVEINIS